MTIKSDRGEFLHQLPDGRILAWGWRFRPAGDPFRPALHYTPVRVYACVWRWDQRSDIVPERIVGTARLVSEAARIGRDALRQHVLPAVRAFAEAQGVAITPPRA
jgi:hypothetical protein